MRIAGLIALVLVFFVADVLLGSVYIPFLKVLEIVSGAGEEGVWKQIVLTIRLPRAVTALVAGAALSVSGLLMQTLFRNPLAGPYVLGVSSGASLGVALVFMASTVLGAQGLVSDMAGSVGIVTAAAVGACLSLLLISAAAGYARDNTTLLIIGLMFGHITGAMVGIMQFMSEARDLQGFIIWELGSFGNVVKTQLLLLLGACVGGLGLAMVLSKSLNVLVLGENYAASMGVNSKVIRNWIILSTALLAGSVTAFCGPIAFLGMAIPHISRALFRTADHKILTPVTALTGAGIAVFCDIIAQLPFTHQALPINAVTSLIGAPVVIWVIIKRKRS